MIRISYGFTPNITVIILSSGHIVMAATMVTVIAVLICYICHRGFVAACMRSVSAAAASLTAFPSGELKNPDQRGMRSSSPLRGCNSGDT